MDRIEMKKVIPHREPMLLVDEAEVIDGVAVGKYTVKGEEFFLDGHFPDNPIVPGVILCEMMAQISCILVDESGFTPYFTGMNEIKFKRKVLPGDTIVFKIELKSKKGTFYFFQGRAYVEEKLVLSGELSFSVSENQNNR